MIKIIHKDCKGELKLEDLQNGICASCLKILNSQSVTYRNDSNPPTVGDRAYYSNRFMDIAETIIDQARGVKTSDYGETWKRLGLKGIYVKIFIKEGRLNELVWKKDCNQVASKNEGIKDTLMDLAAYAIYGLICLEENNLHGDDAVEEHLLSMRDAIDKKLDEIGDD